MAIDDTVGLTQLPVELIALKAYTNSPLEITLYAGTISFDQVKYEFQGHRKKTHSDECGRESLASLRLVNQTFCREATPLLFKHIFATSLSGLARLRQISVSPLAGCVQHIDIGNDRHPGDLAEGTRYAEDLDGLLSRCLGRLPHLRSLDFAGSRTNHRDTGESLVHSLRKSLLYVDLPVLRELDIAVPAAQSFIPFLFLDLFPTRVPLRRLLGRLRHLGLQQARTWYNPDIFPNARYSQYIIGLLGLAENLQSLALSSTEALNIDDLTIPGSRRLRSLSLSRVSFSGETIEALVHHSRDYLESVELLECELNEGSTWEEVLGGALCELPKLTKFKMEQCGYATTNASTGPALDQIVRRDNQPIETQHAEDWAALGRLMLHVNADHE